MKEENFNVDNIGIGDDDGRGDNDDDKIWGVVKLLRTNVSPPRRGEVTRRPSRPLSPRRGEVQLADQRVTTTQGRGDAATMHASDTTQGRGAAGVAEFQCSLFTSGGVLQVLACRGRVPRWSHSDRSTAWLEKTVEIFRHDIDYMQEFDWRPYLGMIVPGELHGHLDVCDIVAPLLSFECIEWHPADRVMQPRVIPLDQHCMALRGVQLYDWTVVHGVWISEWGNRRNTRLRDLHPLPTWDFVPTPEYRDWYMRSYGHMLRLTAYVPQPAAP
ncbi:hypothetical protein Ahy_B08g092941 [Arachis hypogaea]|uniref:Aminotransferase-like plant mobile domain-containing protein n=1 Tax=Arachis hypogaea TaxID=3818 RepID=A0A444Y509_ARAHY|nr:hypothetical protein Ahy_B08g092941 [Arachis hypogaea]